MPIRLTLTALVVLLGTGSPLAWSGTAVGQEPMTAAEAAAKTVAEEPEGRSFTESVAQSFGREHATTIQRCAKDTRRPDLADFSLFLRVDAAGMVDDALVNPTTNLAACVQARMKGWRTTTPPRPGSWVKVSVKLKRKK